MTSVTRVNRVSRDQVAIGVDTHKDVHVAVALDHTGARLGELPLPATQSGFAVLQAWAGRFGDPVYGIEGTSSYGAGLTRHLIRDGARVLEVNRPDRHVRRELGGKSDPIDAEAAALAVLSGRAQVQPKSGDGFVESLRHLRMARSSAVRAQTAAMNQLKAVLVTAPPALREGLQHHSTTRLIDACIRLRPITNEFTTPDAVRFTLNALATRWRRLAQEAATLYKLLHQLVAAHAPDLLAVKGVGADSAAALLIAAGDNPHRLHSEAAFAALCGTNPIPASSGKTDKHRLNRGGNREANAALHRIIIVRLRWDEETKAYMAARRSPNRANSLHLIRCLKRHLARRLYRLILQASQPAISAPTAA